MSPESHRIKSDKIACLRQRAVADISLRRKCVRLRFRYRPSLRSESNDQATGYRNSRFGPSFDFRADRRARHAGEEARHADEHVRHRLDARPARPRGFRPSLSRAARWPKRKTCRCARCTKRPAGHLMQRKVCRRRLRRRFFKIPWHRRPAGEAMGRRRRRLLQRWVGDRLEAYRTMAFGADDMIDRQDACRTIWR